MFLRYVFDLDFFFDGFCEVNGIFVISLLRKLGEEDNLGNVFFLFLSFSFVLVMVFMRIKGNFIV